MKKFEHIPESELADLPEDEQRMIKEAFDGLVDMLNDSLLLEDSEHLRWLDRRSTRLADTVRICNLTHSVDEAGPMPDSMKQNYQKAMADGPATLMIKVVETLTAGFMLTVAAIREAEADMPDDAPLDHLDLLNEMFMLCVSRLALSIAELAIDE